MAKRKMTSRRRRTRKPRRFKSIASRQQLMSFKRTCQFIDIATNNFGPTFGAYSFKLSDLPNYTEFTALFDSYVLRMIKITIVPGVNNMNLPASSNPPNYVPAPNFYTVIDHDDAIAPTSINQLFQYDTFRMHRGFKTISRYFKPALADAVYGGISTAYTVKTNQLIDATYPDVAHYGFKYAIDDFNPSGTSDIVYRVYCTYYFQCKGVR